MLERSFNKVETFFADSKVFKADIVTIKPFTTSPTCKPNFKSKGQLKQALMA